MISKAYNWKRFLLSGAAGFASLVLFAAVYIFGHRDPHDAPEIGRFGAFCFFGGSACLIYLCLLPLVGLPFMWLGDRCFPGMNTAAFCLLGGLLFGLAGPGIVACFGSNREELLFCAFAFSIPGFAASGTYRGRRG